MKKIGFLLLMLFATTVNAEYAKGTIDQIKMCSTGQAGWIRTIQFQVSGKWFGTYADYSYGAGSTDHDNSQTTSLLFMAFSQGKVIEVNATDVWDKYHNKCGVSSGFSVYNNAGDYIQISRN
ncbi:MAG: hypothetical protein JKY55_13995 [Aliivibrio sp.]|uniref:hypothetical protein n=1 Tax=Aliivibrio sp. TaxID=1872443 RepID=UPI001A4DD869|nr:hypothetical protein [Aliivibrio sp.]